MQSTHNFKFWNLLLGWSVFAIALIVYILSLEPTVSFWDAGEYISTSAKLQVGHPPGAPLYQMLGAFISLFAPNAESIAFMVNMLSALASAFTIAFMFWSLTLLLRKIAFTQEKTTQQQNYGILLAAFFASTAFIFTDSFWFNAVEAEVYAMASCIMALLFYLGLLWQRDLDKPRGNKWLILMSFVVGLSFGVHFMGLLTIPAIGFLYYFKKTEKITLKNFAIALLVNVGILLFIFKLLLPYTLQYFSSMEIFFINSVGLPFHSGSIIAGILLIAAFYYALKYTRKNGLVTLNTLALCILFILIGFSSWVMLPIRANAGPPINENRPENARELLAYYNREQYPETHLFYGPMFTDIYGGLDPKKPYLDAKPNYEKDEVLGKYVIVNQYKNALQNTEDKHKGLLPRMWSADRANNYIQFMGGLNIKPLPQYASNIELNQSIDALQNDFKEGLISVKEYERYITEISPFIEVVPPSLWQNLDYMIRFQFSYMYGRYFMWNFVGRQNDVQGEGGILNGNWLSGISFIDEARLGNQSEITSDMRNNKARNTYYFLPFILGLIGVFFHFNRDLKSFWVLLLFFLFTGLALKFYLNERMYEVRERDYALVGSFYVFALWMGYGIYAIYQKVASKFSAKFALSLTGIVAFIAGPAILAQQNWDDHDRSGKYSAQFLAKSYLDSCDENALIFTIGDNDTFGIWYAQEIEGYRTDVRVINTSLFAKDWYIDDMKKQAYESAPIPSQLTHKQYRDGSRDYIFLDEKTTDTLEIKEWMKWVASESQKQKVTLQNEQIVNTFPTKHIKIPVDKEMVLQNGIVAPENADQIVDYLYLTIKSQILYKNRILMLDILANNNWERPIYFSGGSYAEEEFLWLKDYIQLEGNALKLVPIKTPINKNNPYEFGRVNALKSYEIIKSWDWGNMGSPDIYHDTETRKNAVSFRSLITRVAEALMQQGYDDKAKELLDIGMQHMPVAFYDKYTLVEPFVSGYYELDEKEAARAVFEELEVKYQELLTYYSSLSIQLQERLAEDIIIEIERYRSLVDVVIIYGDKEIMKDKVDAFNEHLKLFSHFYGEDRSTQLPEEDEFLQDSLPELDSLELDI